MVFKSLISLLENKKKPMLKRTLLLIITILLSISGFCQDSGWTLTRCIDYALAHNLDLNQNILNERMAQLQYHQSRLSQLPSLSLNSNYGRSFGRSIDPTTNQFIESNYDFVGANGNIDALLFGWFSKRKTIQKNQLSLKATQKDYHQLQDDIQLNVATGFLRILLAQEQIKIHQEQIGLSLKQLDQTSAFVQAGRSTELELAQIKAQLAQDSAAYFSAINDWQQAQLQLKAIMNLDFESAFQIQVPEQLEPPLQEFLQNSPGQIYLQALQHHYGIESKAFQIQAAQKEVAIQKSNLYPQLSIGFQTGTNFSSTQKDFLNPRVIGTKPTGNFVTIGQQEYPVFQPNIDYSLATTPFFSQLKNNFRQTAALTLSIPLFNGWSGQTAIKQAKIDRENKQIELEKVKLQLKEDVYQAYYDAKAALEQYNARQKAVEMNGIALNYAQKRYGIGLVSLIDLLTNQNNSFKSQSEAASAKYDLLFKLKVLDYYLGKNLKLEP